MRVAIGVSSHSGWAWVVTAGFDAGRPVVRGRDRVELLDGGGPRQPYHAAHGKDPAAAVRIVEAGWASARAGARRVLRGLIADLEPDELAAVAVLGVAREVPDVPTVLASHARMHACEGELYRAVVAEEAVRLGLTVSRQQPDDRVDGPVGRALETARTTLGPPWQKEHRQAAAAALRLLARGSDPKA